MVAMKKAELRTRLRALHEGEAVRSEQSSEMCRHILNSPEYQRSLVIGGYMPLACEADVTLVLRDALHTGKTLVLPLCGDAPSMTLRQVKSLEELERGRYGLLEPAPHTPIVPLEEVELLLVPLEGIDREGYRLGKGGGYYDCLLRSAKVQTIGCALSWQIVDAVPRDAWDRPLKAMADCRGIHDFKR